MKKLRTIFVCVLLIAIVFGTSNTVLAVKGGGGGKPDGGKDNTPADPEITFVSGDKLYVMDADGSHKVVIHTAPSGFYVGSPSWSPDGTMIAFLQACDVWLIDVEVVDGEAKGANPRQITDKGTTYPYNAAYVNLAWSPTNANQFVASSAEPNTGIYLITIPDIGDVMDEKIVTPATGHSVGSPTWNRDGTKIVFSESYMEDLPTPNNPYILWGWIKLLDLSKEPNDSGYITTVYSNPDNKVNYTFSNLDWARTEDTLAFVMQAFPSSLQLGIYTLDLTTLDSSPIFKFSGYESAWSPDDSKMVYEGSSKSGTGIYLFDLSTESSSALVKRQPGSLDLDWCRV